MQPPLYWIVYKLYHLSTALYIPIYGSWNELSLSYQSSVLACPAPIDKGCRMLCKYQFTIQTKVAVYRLRREVFDAARGESMER